MITLNDSYNVFLGFHSQDNYSPQGTRRVISLSSAWLTLQPFLSGSDFWKNLKEADMTYQLIRSGLTNHLSSPVRVKVKCCKSRDLFGCWVSLATRTLSSNIMGCHSRPTGNVIVVVVGDLLLCWGAVGAFYSPSWEGQIKVWRYV